METDLLPYIILMLPNVTDMDDDECLLFLNLKYLLEIWLNDFHKHTSSLFLQMISTSERF